MVVDLAQSGVARSPLSSFDVTEPAAAIDLSAAGATIGEPGEFSPRTLTVLAAGFTWEHTSHVFLKRARARRSLLGSLLSSSTRWPATSSRLSAARSYIKTRYAVPYETYFVRQVAVLDRSDDRPAGRLVDATGVAGGLLWHPQVRRVPA